MVTRAPAWAYLARRAALAPLQVSRIAAQMPAGGLRDPSGRAPIPQMLKLSAAYEEDTSRYPSVAASELAVLIEERFRRRMAVC